MNAEGPLANSKKRRKNNSGMTTTSFAFWRLREPLQELRMLALAGLSNLQRPSHGSTT
jgi:hypothetical protein